MTRVAIIGTNGLPGRYGGWDQLMEHLTKLLSKKYSFIVYCSTYSFKSRLKRHNDAKLIYLPLKANGWQSVLYDIIASLHAILFADTIILLGGAGTIMFPFFKLFGLEIVYHPDGIEWKRQKWSRLVQQYLKWLEKIGIKWSDKIISDNSEISKYLDLTYKKSVYLIEYGADHVLHEQLTFETSKLYAIEKGNYAFKVCRIEPENNLDLILEAFKNSNVKIIIVGNWDFSHYGKNLRNKYLDYKNILMLDPIYDQKRLDELRSNCGVYIHGHSVGGTNPSLVEAMYLGLNVLAFDVNFNRATTENSALYFSNTKELISLIEKFSKHNSIFNNIGFNLAIIAKNRYLWKEIISKYDDMFNKKTI